MFLHALPPPQQTAFRSLAARRIAADAHLHDAALAVLAQTREELGLPLTGRPARSPSGLPAWGERVPLGHKGGPRTPLSAPFRSALLLLALSSAGCTAPCAEVAALDPAPHRLALSWDAAGLAEETFSYTLAGETHPPTPHTRDDDGRISVILGDLPALTSVSYQREGRCEGTLTTDNLPTGMPLLSPIDQATAPGWSRLAMVLMGSRYLLAILDREGRYRWHHLPASGEGITEVHADPQGEGLLYNVLDPDREEDLGEIRLQTWADQTRQTLRTPDMHHAFVPLPEGGAAFLAADIRDWTHPKTGTVESVVGDALWEVSAEGELRRVFTIWDHEEPTPHEDWNSEFYPDARDWSHGNGVFYSAARDSYLLSLGNLDVIYELDRASGDPIHRFHPEEWTINGDVYSFPHAPSWTASGTLLVFSYSGFQGGAIEYAVDEEARTLTAIWSHHREDVLLAFLGSTLRLPGGNTLINYGAIGRLEEVSPEGEVVWSLSSPLGYWFGSLAVVDGLYP